MSLSCMMSNRESICIPVFKDQVFRCGGVSPSPGNSDKIYMEDTPIPCDIIGHRLGGGKPHVAIITGWFYPGYHHPNPS
jgi:hypothetical protein